MRIGELSTRSGVPTRTIRFWESEGLVPHPARTASGYRDYDAGVPDRLAFIRQAQTAGLTLSQIRVVLDVRDDGRAPCRHVADAVDERLSEVEARIAELQATRAQLLQIRRRASEQDPAECEGFCSIVTG